MEKVQKEKTKSRESKQQTKTAPKATKKSTKTSTSKTAKKDTATKTKKDSKKVILDSNLTASENVANEKSLKILYVVSECQPFIANGGLADVAGSLPKSITLENDHVDIRVVLPLYSDIKPEFKSLFKYVTNFTVHLGWRQIYAGIFEYKANNVTYYFIDNESYFKRRGTYGHYDDGERFAYFSKAVVEMLPVINFFPTIIHCNDWHTALVPCYIKTGYMHDDRYNKIKHVFTIHNIEYQGKYSKDLIEDLFGIDKKYLPIMEYNNDINLVKSAIEFSDLFSTVSFSYSEELKNPDISHGLSNIILRHSNKLRGIINGIDYDFYNPETDKVIYKNYNVNTSEIKAINKEMLQTEINLPVNADVPIICMASRLVKHKGFDIIVGIFEKVVNDIQFVIVGDGDKQYIDYFKAMEYKYPNNVKAFVGMYSNEWARKFYAGSDALLMPSLNEPCGLSQMVASRYGAVPIVREVGGLKDSIKDFGCLGGGNGYTFKNYNIDDLLYSVKRMINDFKDKASWKEKVKIVMSQDFSWSKSTKEYMKLYNELI